MRFIGFYDYTVVLTYISLFSSVLGMILAIQGRFTLAVICMFISGVCDAFDGVVARSKKNRTEDEKAFGMHIDSLCDVICFGVFPVIFCYCMGVDGIVGVILIFIYCLCALIRLAYFNVLEGNRQKKEEGCNKEYRGLPVTSIAISLPLIYILKFLISKNTFKVVLHIILLLEAFLFVLDFPVKKIDWKKILVGER
ncbi:MAG: CDP-alcohol phosphatidyltransferase family protein [Lachnospiraceae bacterium]|nr:CDP-alcohol phosphatidyltransferase family protein [Lachnospiraceae bacterium]